MGSRRKTKGRKYTDGFKAQALAVLEANEGSIRHAARQLGIAPTTLRNWSEGKAISEEIKADVPVVKRDMALALEEICWKLINSMESKIEEASLSQTGTVMGITFDKMRLLQGQSTQISDNRSQLDRLIAELSDRYQKSPEQIRDDLVKLRPETSLYLVPDGEKKAS